MEDSGLPLLYDIYVRGRRFGTVTEYDLGEAWLQLIDHGVKADEIEIEELE